MLNFTSLALALGGTLTIIIVSYLIGFLLQKATNAINKNTTALNSFWLLFSGFFFMVSMYAILSTKGVTILLPVPFLVFVFNWKKTAPQSLPGIENIRWTKDLQFLVACTLFHFVFYSLGLYSFHPSTIKYINGDFNIYLRVADYLNKTGIENNGLDPIYANEYAAVPYHYGDIWLYALVGKLTQATSSVILLISFTTLSTLAVYGIKTYVYEKFSSYLNNKYSYLYLLVFCGLFSGFTIFFPIFLLHSDIYTFSILNYPKILLPSIIFISLLMLARTRDWTALFVVAMIGGLSFINILPQVYMAVILLMLLSLIKGNITFRKTISLSALLIFATAGFCWLLYKVIAINHGATSATIQDPPTAFNVIAYIKTGINIFIGGSFQLFTITPYLIILIVGLLTIYKKDTWQQIKSVSPDIVLIALLFFCGLACWAVLYPVTSDAVQFFNNGLFTLYAIVISLILILIVVVVRNKGLTIIACLLLFASLYINRKYHFSTAEFDRKEWSKIAEFLKTDTVAPGFVNIHSSVYFASIFNKNTSGYIPLNILNYKWPGYYNLSLNAPYIKCDNTSTYYKMEKEMIEAAPFTKYVRRNNTQNNNNQYLVTNFIKEHHIKYITVATDTILPSYLRPVIKDSLILKTSGWTLYRLDNK